MTALKCKTRGMTNPQGKPRVYFCSHEEDFSRCFEEVCQDILAISDCAIYYYEPGGSPEQDPDYESNLSQMQLFVMPVTSRLLKGGCRAIDREFRYAITHYIPVLPLMQEGGLDRDFNRVCGDLQYLYKNDPDVTALRYEEKLRKFLETVLVSDELACKVRSAFDAYIFLSYRKKDRRYAQELMRLIHQNDFCRDIAIWYDEFLVPGENFRDSIRTAMQKSALFVLTVTPNLLENGNYVVVCEYPEAKASDKRILPVEMQNTDRTTLETMYPGIPGCAMPTGLNQAFLDALRGLALRENDTPEHDFFVGLAYLEGIDVEVDHARALRLILSASEAGVTEAVEKLVNMYASGQGVPRDLQKATEWKQKLVNLRVRDFNADPSEKNTFLLLDEQRDMADVMVRMGAVTQAQQLYTQTAELARMYLEHFPSAPAGQRRSAALCCLGAIQYQKDQYQAAMDYYRQSEECLLTALKLVGVELTDRTAKLTGPEDPLAAILLSDLCVCLCGLGDAQVRLGETEQSVTYMENAQRCYDRMLCYLECDLLANRFACYRHQLSVVYERLGDMEYRRGRDDGARKYYLAALRLDEQRMAEAKETRDFEAWDSYAVSCFRLAVMDPEHPDKDYLEKACDIWRQLVALLPEFPVYAERLAEAERLLTKAGPGGSPKPAPVSMPKPTPAARPKPQPKPAPPPPAKPKTPEEIFAEQLAKAEAGDLEAGYQVAVCYAEGKGVKKDILLAIKWALPYNLPREKHSDKRYNLVVSLALEAPYELIGRDIYQNAADWARSAAANGCFGAIGLMEEACRNGVYDAKSGCKKKRPLGPVYWKFYAWLAPKRYKSKQRRRERRRRRR